ncbi:alginate O-acetyltransferase AlgF [Cognatishimia sp. SS12]|nr:alginate O-acetyltransferase AlgF [Cognatishimia sp. SS12]
MQTSAMFCACLATLGLLTTAALGGDDRLYEGVFAPNTSFIRVVAPGAQFAAVDGHRLPTEDLVISAYVNVAPGEVAVDLAATAVPVPVAANLHYTVLVHDSGAHAVITDDLQASPAKADVTFYNLSDQAGVTLFAPAASAAVFEDVAPQTGAAMALRAPLTLTFEARAAGVTLAAAEAVALRRKEGVSLVLTGAAGVYELSASPHRYQK